MAHMHEIGGKAGAARGTSTPTIAKVRNKSDLVASFLTSHLLG